jgi:hypothetical protein
MPNQVIFVEQIEANHLWQELIENNVLFLRNVNPSCFLQFSLCLAICLFPPFAWKMRSSSQCGLMAAKLSAIRLCSRKKMVCIAVSPG